ncbi:MAG: flagellar biosynthesis protein FlhA [Candidatus Kapabacteria bacterium]|nr:flagellar biosynthesis protein FlhA [Candidatus Kapabacteria bacterium]
MAKFQPMAFLESGPVARAKDRFSPYITKNQDIALAVAVLSVLALLILPLPAFLLDFLLAISLTLAVVILMVSVYITTPLEFSAFPMILLITTLYRLGLNVATTRLILSEGNAGHIIHAFGSFVIKGNYVVGIIIFIILLVINFVVVIKGSSRIAEVAARFTLDALPGKQMSIDADLNAGFIDEHTARSRRENLTQESDFYGAMDGAAKFIRGDAIAGIIITGINIFGGFAIGMFQRNMSLTDALASYTILTIGDGLVTQIPSLLVSVAGGLVVTRSGSSEKLESVLGKQFGSKPRAMAITSAAMIAISFIPGFPMFPFLLLASLTGGFAYVNSQKIKKVSDDQLKKELQEAEIAARPTDQPVEELLKVDPIEIELGYSLIALVDETQGGDVFKRITNVRRQLATELGIILPPVRVRDNLQLEPEEYVVRIRGNEIARNLLYPVRLLAMNPGTAEGELTGLKVTEPVFGLPATWIPMTERENAEIMGYTVVEAATVLTTHLTELLRRNSDKLLTRQDVKHLVENLKSDFPALIEEMTPDALPIVTLQKVLQNLLREGIPIRDLPLVIEALLEYYKVTKNVDVLTEYVRHNMSEAIKKLFEDQNGTIHAIALDPGIEHTMTTALQSGNQSGLSASLGLAPDIVSSVQKSLSDAIDEITLAGFLPTVICSAQVRPYFYRMIHTAFPMVNVISYTELPAETEVEIHGRVGV